MLAEATFCLALAVYFEARSEPLAGQYQVAQVVMNRVDSWRYPNTICGVVEQTHQFTFLWDGTDLTIKNKQAWATAVQVAILTRARKPNYHSACHYARKDISPWWAKKKVKVVTVGRHTFYEGGC